MKLTGRSSLPTVAVAVGDALRRRGIRAVLTGGACASLYTRGAYRSADVDFVLSGRVTQKQLDDALLAIGFVRRRDSYVHPRLPFFVEFPRGPLAIGGDFRIRPVRRRSRAATTWTLSATDACRDRLAAFYHWRDRQALRAAVAIGLDHRIGVARVRRWSREEGAEAAFEEFRRELRAARARRRRRSG